MKYLIAFCWIILVGILGYIPDQGDILWILSCYAPLFVLYIVTYRYFKAHSDILFFIFLSIFLRLLLIFAFPNLSDDIYRFLWDGHLINDGINPYLYTPAEFTAGQESHSEIYQVLFPLLNSPNYYSIYPPVCQAIFASCTWVFPNDIYWATVLMKVLFVAGETLSIYFLMKLTRMAGFTLKRVLLYSLNPLILIELCGNLHFESWMILFLILALWAYIRRRFKFFGLFMGMSIGAKLLPLMFLPFFLFRTRANDLIRAFAMMLLVFAVMFAPFLSWDLVYHLSESINLYFQKFEFNASIYYVVRWIGYQFKGYNIIQTAGPFLYGSAFVIIMVLVFTEGRKSFRSLLERLLLAFTTYLLLATTVHPWYLAIPVLFSVFTHYRYPIFWSGLICCTYVNYAYDPYHENLWVVALEYSIVFGLILIEVFRVPLAGIFIQYWKGVQSWLKL
ncbi:MAG: polyprenol phosphomannose-dependent alpha 1,6 mannosyltransferase MptB [Saprospiraceae bacterium]|nr:polyprenol phosphomannose-dependent alpha 1,6 mannosyltransferase MptB [Saprospiraceae bacterium]